MSEAILGKKAQSGILIEAVNLMGNRDCDDLILLRLVRFLCSYD